MDFTYLHGFRIAVKDDNDKLDAFFNDFSNKFDGGSSYNSFKSKYESLDDIITPVGFDLDKNFKLYVSNKKLFFVPISRNDEVHGVYFNLFKKIFDEYANKKL